MATQDVRFVMTVDDSGFIRKMTEAEQAVYKLKNTTKQADSTFSQLFGTFTLGNLAASGIQRLFSGITQSITSGIKGAIEEEQSQRRLIAALEMSGRAHSGNAASMLRFAQEQSKLTLYTHEQIEAVETLFATMTKLDAEGLKRATKGAMGLASVMQTDLFSAASKMLNVIEGNSNALRGTGIVLDDNLPKHEKLEQLLTRTIPLWTRAAAETESYGGKISQFTKAWNEFTESLGKDAIKASGITGYLKEYTDQLNHVNDTAKDTRLSIGLVFSGAYGTGPVPLLVRIMGQIDDAMSGINVSAGKVSASMREFLGDPRNAPGPYFTETSVALDKTNTKLLATDALFGRMTAHYQIFSQVIREMQNLNLFNQPGTFDPRLDTRIPDEAKAWIEAQKAFAQEATAEIKDEYGDIEDYSNEFYQDITRGFTNAFMQLRLSVAGFKDFFIATWTAIKQAFFQILGDMLARWVKMAFVRGLMSIFAPGPFFSAAGGGLAMASGFEGVISRPTPILVGEAGPEYVSVRPMAGAGAGGGTITLNFNAPLIATTGISRSDLERAGADLVAVVKTQLRRVGRSL